MIAVGRVCSVPRASAALAAGVFQTKDGRKRPHEKKDAAGSAAGKEKK